MAPNRAKRDSRYEKGIALDYRITSTEIIGSRAEE
jgi:hypothetical protein